LTVLDLFDLSGRVAIVTGAAGSLGGASASALSEAGAEVLLVDIDAAGLDRAAGELSAAGGRVRTVVADVTSLDDIDALLRRLDSEFGRVDILANMAGPAVLGSPETIDMEDVAATLHGVAIARFALCQGVGGRMLRAGRGSIINTGSLASVTALGRGHIAYSMAMGAVVQMTRELSTEWSGRGVRVNAILPGQILNRGLSERFAADPDFERTVLRGLPIGRVGSKDEVRGVVLFLASDAASFVTGALIPLDGGNLAKNAGGSHPGMVP
jgi:NAD(P)-dependent dehydrogenase (short-subunit alcohol dehydrogenase family)